jgi:branched-chain amino acid transport system permease protein
MLTILFDGIAYGMLLFVLACGLAVTLGLINLTAYVSFFGAGISRLLACGAWSGEPFSVD